MSEIFISAFLGAFSAFLFFRMGEFINRVVQRKYTHLSALVKLDRALNENYDILNGNGYHYEMLRKQNKEAKAQNVPLFSGNRISPIFIDDQLLSDLVNIDYYNELFSYKTKIRRFNQDLESTFALLDMLKNSRINNIINDETYRVGQDNIFNKLSDISNFNNHLQNLTRELIAKARVLQNEDRTFSQRFYNLIIKRRYSDKFNGLFLTELKKVDNDISRVTKKSKEELDKIFNYH